MLTLPDRKNNFIMIKDFSTAISYYGKAIQFIFKYRLGWYFLIPLILTLLLFFAGMGISEHFTDYTDQWLDAKLKFDETAWYFKLLNTLVFSFIWLIFKVLFFLIFAYFAGFIILIILSPVLSHLSERVEEILTGHEYPFDLSQMLKDVLRGISLAIRNLFKEIGFMLLFFLLGFIPLVGLLVPVGLFFISAYYYGFSFMDYAIERKKLSVKASVREVSLNKGTAIGNGFVFALILMIPFIGSVFSSFVAVISTVAATMSVYSERWKNLG
jgi:CysZ protein